MTELLRSVAAERPTQVALSDLKSSLGWAGLADLCERSVRALDSLQLDSSSRVAVVMRNSVDAALVFLMARYAGVELTAVSFHLTPSELEYVFADARVAAVVCDPTTVDAVTAAASTVGVPHVFIGDIDGGSARPAPHVVGFREWVLKFDTGSVDLTRGAAANLLYTSGTTGFPKGVLTPQNLASTIEEYIAAYPEPVDAGPFLTVGPLYHAGPLGSLRRLTSGRPLIVMRQFHPIEALRAIQEHSVTGATSVPTHFLRLLQLDDADRKRFDVSSLGFVDHTGSWCPPEVKRRMIDWFGPVLEERYGGTESGTVCTIDSHEWLEHPGSVGRCSSRFTAVVVDDDGNELPIGTTGRLFFADATGRGVVYQNDPEKTAAAHLRPGVFTLGDIGHVDEGGYVFITGRSADLIVSGGVNLYPAEIERVLLRVPGVADAAVVGAPDDLMGEKAVAFIVSSNVDMSADFVIEEAKRSLAGPKVPRDIRFIPELPRNPMGKLDRKQLKARIAPMKGTQS